MSEKMRPMMVKSTSALGGAAIYALFGVLWIYFSDSALSMFVADAARLTTLQTFKGWFFILITATLVYWLMRRHGLDVEQSHRDLNASERSLQLLFQALPLGVATVKGRVLSSVNDRLCEMLGYSSDEMVGHNSRKFYVDEEEYERVGRELYAATASEGRCFMEVRWRNRDGRTMNVLLGAAVASEGSGHMDIVLSALDITEQTKRDAMYRLLFEGAHDALFLMDESGFADCNPRAEELYGATRDQLVQASPVDFSPEWQPNGEGSAEASSRHIRAALAGEPQLFEWLHHKADGTPFDVEVSLNRIEFGGETFLLAMARDITTRKQAETALRSSEESLASIFRAAPAGISVVRERALVRVNDRFCEIFGYERDELLGDGTRKLYVSEEEYRRCGQGIYDQLETDGVSSVEGHMVRKDGRKIHVLINSAIYADGSEGMTVTSSVLDITDRKLAERALRENEEYLDSVFRTTPTGIGVVEDRIVVSANDRFCEILGYPRDEVEGQSVTRFYASQEEYERCGKEIYDSIQEQGTCAVEGLGRRKDGCEVHLLLNAAPLPGVGSGKAITLSLLDITGRKKAEQALRANEEYLNSIFRATPTGIGVLRDREVITVNDRFCELVGYKREELVGQSIRKVYVSNDEYERCGREIYDSLKLYGTCSVEARIRRKSGEEVDLLLNASPMPASDDGQAVTFSVLDITARKKMEEALLVHRNKLEELVRERTGELTDSNAQLQRLVAESEARTGQAATLNEMGELLEACVSEEETYRVVGGVCARLFPDDAGCIGILDESEWSIKVVASWGRAEGCRREFAHNDCWAIRRGKVHIVSDPATTPLCAHVEAKSECITMCVPMSAQGRVLGIAHMRVRQDLHELGEHERELAIRERQLLLSGMVERYAPSLVNLRLRETLREQSIRDRLTGLFNRRHMEETLVRELARARRRRTALGVIMVDVDYFKRFNDTYGHETGDVVLRELGRFLCAQVRTEDIPCRYGGEELLLILPDSCLKDCAVRAEEIRCGIETHVSAVHNGDRLGVTASIGVASFPEHGDNVDSLLAAADAALYRAKESGRNQVVCHGF